MKQKCEVFELILLILSQSENHFFLDLKKEGTFTG